MAPTWASSMIGNYRSLFKKTYSRDTTCTDDEIWDICNSVYDDRDHTIEDQQRVIAMKDKEDEKGEKKE